jgi:predicted P-loop ATPase
MGIKLRYDTFTYMGTIDGLDGYGPALTGDAIDALYVEVWKRFDLKYTQGDFGVILLNEARKNTYHPVCEYLDSLQWDGVPRIGEWLHAYLGAGDTEANRAIGRGILIAAVRRVRKPGTKYDCMPVLEGPQGCGKSTALMLLCPKPEWFSDNLHLNAEQRQIMEIAAGKWICEVSELRGMKRAEVEQTRTFVSRQADGARLAWGRGNATVRPRQFVLVGTTNSQDYLPDDSGNRRFLPVAVDKWGGGCIDLDALQRDRDQLWAEAAHCEAAGEQLVPGAGIIAQLKELQSEREITDEWDNKVKPWLDQNYPPSHADFSPQRVTMAEVALGALGIETGRLDSVLQKRLARSMKNAGWFMAQRSNGMRFWKRAEVEIVP